MATSYRREIIILGKTGNGKSSLGNSLLGTERFPSKQTLNPVTEQCQKESNNRLTVIDTPGLFDANTPVADTGLKILSSLDVCPNPHAFIVVFSAFSRMSHDELRTMHLLRLIFNESCLKHAIVVFTCYNESNTDIDFENFWKARIPMREFVEECGGRVLRIDNMDNSGKRSERVDDIILSIDKLSEFGKKRFKSTYKREHEQVFREQQRRNAAKRLQGGQTASDLFEEEVADINNELANVFNRLFEQAKSLKEKLKLGKILFGFGCVAVNVIGVGISVGTGRTFPFLVTASTTLSSLGAAALAPRNSTTILQAVGAFLVSPETILEDVTGLSHYISSLKSVFRRPNATGGK